MSRNLRVCSMCENIEKELKSDINKNTLADIGRNNPEYFKNNDYYYECFYCTYEEDVELSVYKHCKYKLEHEILNE